MRRMALAGAFVLLLPLHAHAFGPGGHVEAAEGTYDQVARLPGNQALQGNATARRCYMWGSVFPDLRNFTSWRQSLEDLKRRLERIPGVRRVRLDFTDLRYPGFDTHSPRMNLHIISRARATASPELLAFALGALAHGCHDRDEQTFTMHRTALAGRAGDVSLGPAVSGSAQGFGVGGEVQLLNEAMREANQPTSRLRWLQTAPRTLHGTSFLARVRSTALNQRMKAFYYDAAKSWTLARNANANVISAQGFMNSVRLLEAGAVIVAAVFGRESFGRAARILKSRYVDLTWWADIIYNVADLLARGLTFGTRGVFDLADLVLFFCKGKLLKDRHLYDVVEGAVYGGRSWRRVVRRYGSVPEFQRLRASGMLTPANHDFPEVARAIALDISARGVASRWVDWPLIDSRALRGVAAQSYLVDPVPARPARPRWWQVWRMRSWRARMATWRQQHERGFEARAGGFMVQDVRWIDPTNGQAIDRLRANDHGRRVRVEVALQGLHPRATWLYRNQALACELVIWEDALRGNDILLTRQSISVPVNQVDPLQYGSVAPPVLSLEVPVPLTRGTRGYHVELRYDGRRVFTTDWDQVERKGAVNPHYAASYGTYLASGFHSLAIAGR